MSLFNRDERQEIINEIGTREQFYARRRAHRTFEVVSIQADDPESSGRYYYNLGDMREHFPNLTSFVEADDFHSLKLVSGLNSLEITVCSEEEHIEEAAWNDYQAEQERINDQIRQAYCGYEEF